MPTSSAPPADARRRDRCGRGGRQQLGPARLARSGSARHQGDQRSARIRGAGGKLLKVAFDRADIGKAVQAFARRTQLGGGLRAAQPQGSEQCHRLGRHAQHATDILRVTHHARAARLDHERQRLQSIDRCLHFRLGRVQHRIAIVLLVAACRQCIERQRIDVRDRVLLFHQHAQHAAFEQRQSGQRHPCVSDGEVTGVGVRPVRCSQRPSQVLGGSWPVRT